MTRNTLLSVIIIVLVIASGVLLYRSFSDRPLVIAPATVSSQDVIIRNQIDRLDVRIKKAIKKVENHGALDELSEGSQFQELESKYIRPIIIGQQGRTNPFIPPQQATPLP